MWLAIVMLIVIFSIMAFLDTKKPKGFPPGPKWIPILGSALAVHKIRRNVRLLTQATAILAEKYGPVLGLKVGTEKVVVVHGLDALKEFLGSDDLNGRPRNFFYKARTWGKRRGVLLVDEEFWTEQRRFVLRHLKDFGFGRRNMSTIIEEEIEVMIDFVKKRIDSNGGSCVFQMPDLFGIHVLNTLWMMMAGIRYAPEDRNLKELQRMLSVLFENIDMMGTLFSHFPVLRYIAPEYSGYNLYIKVHKPIWEFLYDELQKHQSTYNPAEMRDFMDVYINMIKSSKNTETFSEQQLMAICMDLFMAGSETTSKTLGFAFMYLILNPHVIRKAQEEIDRVVGKDRNPSLKDRPNMQYMECIVLESLRMFTGRAFSLPHRALKDTFLQGYFIPKDTMVIANFEGILLGKYSGWTDGFDFRPERFIKNGKISIRDTYLPFGNGKRRCMGETLARANLFLMISTLLQHFDFEICPDAPPLPKNCVDGATPGPYPYKARITLRKC